MDYTSIKKLIEESRQPLSPGRLSEIAVELSSWSAYLAEQFEKIDQIHPERWLEIRKTTTSDHMADLLWEATETGKEWKRLKLQLKYLEKVISSIKLRLRVKEGESFGRY